MNGNSHDEDPRLKGYILEDGEHPSELGAKYMADLLADVGYDPVIPPEE
jgi:lysophospholipase L1-like esterase